MQNYELLWKVFSDYCSLLLIHDKWLRLFHCRIWSCSCFIAGDLGTHFKSDAELPPVSAGQQAPLLVRGRVVLCCILSIYDNLCRNRKGRRQRFQKEETTM